jgi:hypothetical protein
MNYHKFSGLKQYKHVLLQFYRNTKSISKSRCWYRARAQSLAHIEANTTAVVVEKRKSFNVPLTRRQEPSVSLTVQWGRNLRGTGARGNRGLMSHNQKYWWDRYTSPGRTSNVNRSSFWFLLFWSKCTRPCSLSSGAAHRRYLVPLGCQDHFRSGPRTCSCVLKYHLNSSWNRWTAFLWLSFKLSSMKIEGREFFSLSFSASRAAILAFHHLWSNHSRCKW